MPLLQSGPTTILSVTNGSTVSTGSWYQVLSRVTDLCWQAILNTSSVGATAGSTVIIEFSNSTAVAVATVGQTIALTATTDIVSEGGAPATTMRGAWGYVRARMASLTTSTAGSAGTPTLSVIANVRQI